MPKNNVLPKGEFFTTIPDHFLSHIMTELSASELRVMLYIYLHTLGYGKLTDAISYEQFINGVTTRQGQKLDKGAGVSRRSLVPALARLEELGLISRQKQGYRAATIRLEVESIETNKQPTQETIEQRPEQKLKDNLVSEPEVQFLPKSTSKTGQKLHSTCRNLINHEEHINRGTERPVADLEKSSVELITRKIPTLTNQIATRLVKIAFNKHGRDLAYLERLVNYVITTPQLKNPAAVFTSLIKQDADRTLATETRHLRKRFDKTKPSSLATDNSATTLDSTSASQLAKNLTQKGIVSDPAKAQYLVLLAEKNKLGYSNLANLVNLACSTQAGQRSATFEFLLHQAIARANQNYPALAASKSVGMCNPRLDLTKFAPGGKYAHVVQQNL